MCIKKVQDVKTGFLPVIKAIKISDNGEKLVYKEDVLAKTTYYTKHIFELVGMFWKMFRDSQYWKVLFGTSQPAHFILAMAVLCIAFLLYPSNQNVQISPIWMVIYLASFSIHFGTQVWMTFVSGLSLYFNIPRHTFGNIQKVLFPRYFLINAILSFITFAIFIVTKKPQMYDSYNIIQAAALLTCFLVELTTRLYLTSPLLHLICVKTRIEESAGVGKEIGRLNPGSLADCPYYLKVHRTFRRTHVTIAIGNMLSMACTVLHLFHLAQRICYA